MAIKIATFCVFTLFSLNSFSQVQSTGLLPLDSAVKLGIINSKLLKASDAKISIAQAKLKENNTQKYPRINISSSYTRISDNITPFEVKFPGAPVATVLNPQILNQFGENVGISQIIYSGLKVKKNEKALDFLIKASQLDYENDKSTAIFNIINAYYSLYKLQETKVILKENEKLLNARINDLRNLEENGIVLHNDVLKLQIQLSQLNIQQLDINNSYEATIFSFNILLGLPDTLHYSLDTASFFHYNLDKAFLDYEQQAIANRNDLKSADAKLKVAKINIEIAKAAYLPTLSTTANYNYLRPNSRVFPQQDAFKGTWNAGITLAWDLSSLYNNKHFINEAKSSYEQNNQLKLNLADNIKTELYTNYLAYKRAIEHLSLSQQTLAQAKENYKVVFDRLQNNLVLIADLQDAIAYLVQSEVNVLQDKADIDISYFRFLKSMGTLNQ